MSDVYDPLSAGKSKDTEFTPGCRRRRRRRRRHHHHHHNRLCHLLPVPAEVVFNTLILKYYCRILLLYSDKVN
jgi:hypothetical protein